LSKNLLHIEWIPLAAFGEELEQRLRYFLHPEQCADHPPSVCGSEPFEREGLRERR